MTIIFIMLSILGISAGLLLIVFGKSAKSSTRMFGSKTIKFGSNTAITSGIVLVLCILSIFWPESKATDQVRAAQSASPELMRIHLEEWESWPDFIAPVGHFAYSEIPRGKKFVFEPLGRALVKVEGSNTAFLSTPDGPSVRLGLIFDRVGYMSLEEQPVIVTRKVQK